MSILKNLKTDDSIAAAKDSLGGGGPMDSGLYLSTISLAYITKSTGGALGLVLQAKTDAGRDIRQTLWMTNKQGQNFYTNKEGEKNYLPGFVIANSIALLTVGQDLADLDTETKVVNVYSYEAKAEVPTKVDMVMDLLGKQVYIGLIKQTVDKTQKNDAGVYVPTGETRDENDIDKIFRASDMKTEAEIRAQAEEAAFAVTWKAKWTGVVRNKAKGTAGAAGTAGAPKGAATTKKPATSLFG